MPKFILCPSTLETKSTLRTSKEEEEEEEEDGTSAWRVTTHESKAGNRTHLRLILCPPPDAYSVVPSLKKTISWRPPGELCPMNPHTGHPNRKPSGVSLAMVITE